MAGTVEERLMKKAIEYGQRKQEKIKELEEKQRQIAKPKLAPHSATLTRNENVSTSWKLVEVQKNKNNSINRKTDSVFLFLLLLNQAV